MATVSYRCPVEDRCPESDQPGFCANHPDSRLERTRPRIVLPQDPASSGAGTVPGKPTEREQAPLAPVPLIAVRYLGNSVQVPAGGVILGRDTTPALRLPHQVSRVHAHLHWDGWVLRVTDLRSGNGTFVDGRRVAENEPVPVKPGQTLRLGQDVELAVAEIEVDEYGRPR